MKIFILLFIQIFFLFSTCWSEELTSDNVDNLLKKDKFSVVLFYSPWQHECQEKIKIIDRVKVYFKDQNDIFVEKSDIYNDLKLASRFQIEDYCVLKYFVKGSDVPERFV